MLPMVKFAAPSPINQSTRTAVNHPLPTREAHTANGGVQLDFIPPSPPLSPAIAHALLMVMCSWTSDASTTRLPAGSEGVGRPSVAQRSRVVGSIQGIHHPVACRPEGVMGWAGRGNAQAAAALSGAGWLAAAGSEGGQRPAPVLPGRRQWRQGLKRQKGGCITVLKRGCITA